MQAASKQPMTRAQKLRWYSTELITEATAEEKAGHPDGAVAKYLQAAEILLLLAKVEESYTAWKYYADTAAQCQQRARQIIAQQPKKDGQT